MDTVTRFQTLDGTADISHSTNTLGKGMNPIILLQVQVGSRSDWTLKSWCVNCFKRRKTLNSYLLKSTQVCTTQNLSRRIRRTNSSGVLRYKSSSSCRAASTDIPDPLSPLLPIVHLAGLQGCIPYPHIATGCMFELVVLL